MDYYFSKVLDMPFEMAVKSARESLAGLGFSVVTEINMHEKFREKLGLEFRKYKILGACNPEFAYKAVSEEEKIGVLLPCNIVVIEMGSDKTEVAAVNPAASMQAVNNPALGDVATQVTDKLRTFITSLQSTI